MIWIQVWLAWALVGAIGMSFRIRDYRWMDRNYAPHGPVSFPALLFAIIVFGPLSWL